MKTKERIRTVFERKRRLLERSASLGKGEVTTSVRVRDGRTFGKNFRESRFSEYPESSAASQPPLFLQRTRAAGSLRRRSRCDGVLPFSTRVPAGKCLPNIWNQLNLFGTKENIIYPVSLWWWERSDCYGGSPGATSLCCTRDKRIQLSIILSWKLLCKDVLSAQPVETLPFRLQYFPACVALPVRQNRTFLS